MQIKSQILEGIFVSELKNRFLCHVLINGSLEECYIPSSSKLENYVKLQNKKVLLTVNKGKNTRTNYSVFAVKYYNKYIILNLNIANSLLADSIKCGLLSNFPNTSEIYIEKNINGYKSDILLVGQDTIIVEVKGIISTHKISNFPSIYSERAVRQLYILKNLIRNGFKVVYCFISLSPTVRTINLSNEFSDFYQSFTECVKLGMQVKGYRTNFDNNGISISKEIKVLI